MANFKRFRARLDQMTGATYSLLRGALLLSCTMVFCALALYHSGGFDAYRTAGELMSLATVTLLVAVIGSGVVEELTMKK